MKSMTVCQYRKERIEKNGTIHRTAWCGQEIILTPHKPTEKERRTTEKRLALRDRRPLKHCKDCVREKTAARPKWVPQKFRKNYSYTDYMKNMKVG